MKINKALGMAVVTGALLSSPSLAQEGLARCDAILAGGVFDVNSRRVEFDESVKTFDWLCDEEIRTESDVDSVGASLGVPIEGITAELGFDRNQEEFSDWKKTHCEQHQSDRATRLREENLLQKASTEILGSFERCMRSPGLYVWREPTEERDQLVFASRFVRLRDEDATASLKFDYPPTHLQCDSVPATVGGSTKTWRCMRKTLSAFTIPVSSDVNAVAPTALRIPKLTQPTSLVCRPTGETRVLSATTDNRSSQTAPVVLNRSACPSTINLEGRSTAYSAGSGTVSVTVEANVNGAGYRVICSETTPGSINMSANAACSIDVPANASASFRAVHGNTNANAVSTAIKVHQPVVTGSREPVVEE